jgi:hypothetical protein
MKFMTLVKTSSTSKAKTGPTPALYEGIMKLGMEAGAAGVLVQQGGLHDIDKGATVTLKDNELKIIDGPFSESKEWVGGYAVYDVRTKAEAVEWARRFMDLHKQFWPGWEGEVEVRQIMEQPGQ